MIYVFDTSALLAHYRSERGGDRVQAVFDEDDAQILIASVTVAEFARRLRELGADEPDIHSTVSLYRRLMAEVVAVNAEIAWTAFELSCHVPQRLPLVDALIAATARTYHACLVHRDQHMAAIPGHLLDQINLDVSPSE